MKKVIMAPRRTKQTATLEDLIEVKDTLVCEINKVREDVAVIKVKFWFIMVGISFAASAIVTITAAIIKAGV